MHAMLPLISNLALTRLVKTCLWLTKGPTRTMLIPYDRTLVHSRDTSAVSVYCTG